MNYIIEITEEKVDMMSQEVENALMSLGNVMHCLEQMKNENRMQERMGSRMGNQGGYGMGNRMGDRMGNRGNGGNMGSRMWQPNDYDGIGRGRYDGY